MGARRRPGEVRDAIVEYLTVCEEAAVAEIRKAVESLLDGKVSASSVRSYLRLNSGGMFERVARGRYRLRER